MNLKKAILFLFVIILCGCKASYYIDIDDGFKEDVKITFDGAEDYNDDVKFTFDNIALFDSDNVENIDGSLPSSINKYEFTYDSSKKELYSSHKFNTAKDLSRSSFFNSCFKNVKYQTGIISSIQTSNNFMCFERFLNLDEVTISIHTTKQVLDNNADSVSSGTYTWTFNKNNVRTKSIYFKYKTDNGSSNGNNKNGESKTNEEKKNKSSNSSTQSTKMIALLVLIPLFFGSLFAIIFIRQSK